MISPRLRYEGIQTLLEKCGSDGCLFLSVLSIAEEVLGNKIDLIDAIHKCIERGWLDEDFYVLDSTAVLCFFTGKDWSRRSTTTLPTIGYNDYSIVIYHSDRTGFTHYRRRPYDTLVSSRTVKEGYIQSYYIYSWR